MLGWDRVNFGISLIAGFVAALMFAFEQYDWSIGLLLFAGAWGASAWCYHILRTKRNDSEEDRYSPGKPEQMAVAIIVCVIGVGLPTYYIHKAKLDHIIKDKKAEEQRKLDERLDSYQHMATTVYLAPSANPVMTMFTIRNGGKSWVSQYEISCGVPMMIGGTQNGPLGFSGRTQTILTQMSKIPPDGVVRSENRPVFKGG